VPAADLDAQTGDQRNAGALFCIDLSATPIRGVTAPPLKFHDLSAGAVPGGEPGPGPAAAASLVGGAVAALDGPTWRAFAAGALAAGALATVVLAARR
jgi:hypothetical protein